MRINIYVPSHIVKPETVTVLGITRITLSQKKGPIAHQSDE